MVSVQAWSQRESGNLTRLDPPPPKLDPVRHRSSASKIFLVFCALRSSATASSPLLYSARVPMPPRLRLPPLPDPREWSRHFPKAKLRISPDPINQRDFPGRSLLANRVLNDEFVRALKLRPNEVVIEAFAGPGALTRSLIAGGNQEDTAQLAADWVEKRAPSDGTTPVKVGKRRKPKPKLLVVRSDAQADDTKFPTWVDDLRTHKSATSSAETSALPRPRLVVCSEPSPEFLIRGLGMSSNDVPEPLGYIISRRKSTDSAKYPLTVTPSVYEDNLVLSPGSLYIWSTVPDILDHELVAPHVEALDGSAKRDWRAPPPPITLVGQIPDSLMGEQILSQWVSSVIGASYGGPNWLWEYGRARLAFLMAKNRYDVSCSIRPIPLMLSASLQEQARRREAGSASWLRLCTISPRFPLSTMSPTSTNAPQSNSHDRSPSSG